MPLRPFNREQVWLLPPTLGELISNDHPARFVAGFVDSLDRAAWMGLGIGLDGEPLGAPAYHPRVLLCVWLYGFMTGIRSSRKLEVACRDQVPYLWLTGWQHPDHNTLWRFYQAHRDTMRRLLKYTVATAIELELVDLAVQAIDGTKIAANAAGDRTYSKAELQRLLERTETAISELEAQNEGGDESPVPHLPEELQTANKLRQRIKDAMNHLSQHVKMKRVNLTDEDAQLMKGRHGIITGYNAQAMVSPLNAEITKGNGMLITAVEVVDSASDTGQLVPMLEQTEDITGIRTPVTLADGGYHTAANLEAGESRGQMLVMTERYHSELRGPYFKDNFIFNAKTDSYLCPHGHHLHFSGFRRSKYHASERYRVYRTSRTDCRTCPAFGICTRDKHAGRVLWISSSDELLQKHRQWMNTDEAQTLYARRKELNEPAFGIIKEQMHGRGFLLRGLSNVQAEFHLLATAFNLRMLWRVWSKLGKLSNKIRGVITDRLSPTCQIYGFFGLNSRVPSIFNFS